MGWGFVSALSRHHDLWVLVEEEKFRDDIERYLATRSDGFERVRFHFIRKQRNRLLRKVWPPSYYWYYRRWHEDAFGLAMELHAEVGFDLAHQLTMVGFREPGYLWKLGIPFVWGPVGGMGLFPWRFLPSVGLRGAAYYLGYNLYNAVQMRFAARPQLAARAAGNGLITATAENRAGGLQHWGTDSTVIEEVGLPGNIGPGPCGRSETEPLKVLWVGAHTPGKALNLGLAALARVPRELPWELDVLGEGDCTRSWQSLAAKLGIAEQCRFLGWVPREKVLNQMERSHVLLITSLRDLTSSVTVEGLASGLPIICFDHSGFSRVVDETCGMKIPLTEPDSAISDLASAVIRLARDEEHRFSLAQGAAARAREYTWEAKIDALNEIYDKCARTSVEREQTVRTALGTSRQMRPRRPR